MCSSKISSVRGKGATSSQTDSSSSSADPEEQEGEEEIEPLERLVRRRRCSDEWEIMASAEMGQCSSFGSKFSRGL